MTFRGNRGPSSPSPSKERWVSLGSETAKLPERLLLSHARGETLLVTGAGTSRPSGLPDFRQLVLDTYESLDTALHGALMATAPRSSLIDKQIAEANRFDKFDYDVVLGMLERRIDGVGLARGKVRQRIMELVSTVKRGGKLVRPVPAPIHRALISLANRGITTTIATTNFDRLLQQAARRAIETHALGSIPRPSLREDFSGVLHIHGAIGADVGQPVEMVVTDRDFGEFYLRRRIVPDFIYDAARLFNIVLVGYSANDAPMRYLLNAVAADGSRFRDLKERFAFVPSTLPFDSVELEDWRGRGITPIPYDSSSSHLELTTTLLRWAELSAINGNRRKIDGLIKRLVGHSRSSTTEEDRDLFDHMFRRGNRAERLRIARMVSAAGAEVEWLDAMNVISSEPDREIQP